MVFTWLDDNNPKKGLYPKPLQHWAINYRMQKEGLLQPEKMDDMDWEQYIFYTGLIEAQDEEERKAMEAMKKNNKPKH